MFRYLFFSHFWCFICFFLIYFIIYLFIALFYSLSLSLFLFRYLSTCTRWQEVTRGQFNVSVSIRVHTNPRTRLPNPHDHYHVGITIHKLTLFSEMRNLLPEGCNLQVPPSPLFKEIRYYALIPTGNLKSI